MDGAQNKRAPQPRMVERTCAGCGKPFQARQADVNRGWGKHCSKACAQAPADQLHAHVPDHLREFVQAVATNYSSVDNVESLRCNGCGADLDDKEDHKPNCIVLRAQALLEPKGGAA